MAKKQNNYINAELIKKLILPSFITGKKYYLYVHTRPDKNEPFYVGIGTMDRNKNYYRALCHIKRNNIWKRIVQKINKYNILIISESDIKQKILDFEIEYIKLLGKKSKGTGTLANITDGGEGLKGHKIIWTDEMRNKIREANKKRIFKDSTREKHRINLKKRGIINKKNG